MRTIFNDFKKNGKYPSPLKFNKIPHTKEEDVELNKDENQTKSQLLALIDENISNLPEKLIQHFKDEKKILKIKTAKKNVILDFLNNVRRKVNENSGCSENDNFC